MFEMGACSRLRKGIGGKLGRIMKFAEYGAELATKPFGHPLVRSFVDTLHTLTRTEIKDECLVKIINK